MGTPLYQLLLLLLLVVSECSCIQWSSSALKEDAAVYACDNSDLTLSWDVSKTTGETIVDVQWFYEGRSQEMIAIMTRGHLNVMPAFSGRVELTANARLVIHHVTVGEKGNYSVEVNGMDSSGQLVTLRRTSMVVIRDGLVTTDGQLHASQMAVAVFSNSTQQWHVALACGTFTYPDTPPFTVEWTTPSGQSVSSSQYKEGQFLLLLDNPVSGGFYTCRVPQRSASVACIHGNSTDVSSTVVVDDVKARLTLLEAENRQLKERLLDVTNEANAKINQANVKINENKAEINKTNVEVNENKAEINQANDVSSQLVQKLQDEKTKQASFYATALNDTYRPSHGNMLIPTDVPLNQGNGFDLSTGKFTAPFNGTYIFKAGRWGVGSLYDTFYYRNVYLAVDGKQEPWVVTSFDGTNHALSFKAVVSVRANQSVWLQFGGNSHVTYKGSHSNWFSGFLVAYDP